MQLMRRVKLILSFLIMAYFVHAGNWPAGFVERKLAGDLDPTGLVLTPDGRLLIMQKNGKILVLEDDRLLPDPFLNIEVDNYNERGLSGLVLDPDFDRNQFVYVYYTVAGEDRNRISRFIASGNFIIPGSEKIIFELDPMEGPIHNGGAMVFGPDGMLYVATGDGAIPNAAQDMSSTLGKVLRIRSDGSIPEDNPFYTRTSGNARAIWALGFRNPFSIALEPGGERIFVCDVGQASWEEVNAVGAGYNYGWPLIEGPSHGQSVPEDYRDPLYYYDHESGCSVIGAAFYEPETKVFPEVYHGNFFFADYCAGEIRRLDPNSGDYLGVFASAINRPVALLTGPDGSLYYLERAGFGGGSANDNTSSPNGSLYKVRYTGSGAPFIAIQPEDNFLPRGETATFTVRALGAPDLAYQWYADGVELAGAVNDTLVLRSVVLQDSGTVYRCLVRNPLDTVWSDTAHLRVTSNRRPVVDILFPAAGELYNAGDTLYFEGYVEDPEDGVIASVNWEWTVDFHHDSHVHPALSGYKGEPSGEFIIPRLGEVSPGVWYRVYLRSTDEMGLENESWVDVFPNLTDFTVTAPGGIPVLVNGQRIDGERTVVSVVGIYHFLDAPMIYFSADSVYFFNRWEGRTSENKWIYEAIPGVPTDTLMAIYSAVSLGSGTGLTGHYFNDPGFRFFGRHLLTRLDSTIDFQWGGGPPASGLPDDLFSVRWKGFLEAPLDGTYRMQVIADDGVRLYLDDKLLIDGWVDQPPTSYTAEVNLQTARRYPVRIEYYENGGGAEIRWLWSHAFFTSRIVPSRQLYPDNSIPEAPGEGISVYPVPAEDWLYVLLKSPFAQMVSWSLVDIQGKEYLNGSTFIEAPADVLSIDISGIPMGVYFLRSNTGVQGVEATPVVIR